MQAERLIALLKETEAAADAADNLYSKVWAAADEEDGLEDAKYLIGEVTSSLDSIREGLQRRLFALERP